MAMRRSTRMMLGRAAAEERRLPGRKMEIEYERWGEPEDRYGREPRGNRREPVRKRACLAYCSRIAYSSPLFSYHFQYMKVK